MTPNRQDQNDANENATRKPTPPTIYAAFHDAGRAESAAGALIDHGVKAESISLVVSEEYNQRRGTVDDPELNYTQPTVVSGEAGSTGRFDPLGNDLRVGTPPVMGGNLGPVGESAELGLNPAQDDYPRSGAGLPTEFASRPPAAKSDFNADLDKRGYNEGYETGVPNVEADNSVQDHRENEARLSVERDEGLDINRPAEADIRSARDSDRTIGAPAYDPERAAKMGVTTTTIADAADAAKKGVVAGLGLGALAAAAALTIPGVGVILGGGALATAIAGLAASAGAGAVAGGVVGYLKDQGVPANDIPHYQNAYENGGAILSVHLDEDSDRAKIESVLSKYGADRVERYGYAA